MSRIGHNGGPLADGWIARHRGVRSHELVGHGLRVTPADPSNPRCHSKGEAWEDLIMTCNFADGRVRNGGQWMELRRGELVGAVSYLAQRWNWTPKVVRKFLDDLENDGMITLKKPGVQNGTQKGKQSTVITLCNYDAYQSIPFDEGQANEEAEGKQGASKGQAEGNKNNKLTTKQITPISARAIDREGQDRGKAFWSNAMEVPGGYNPDEGIFRDPATGVLQLVNGVRAAWLERFGGDEQALELALIQAAPYVKPNGAHGIRTQIEAQLAKQLSWKADRTKSEKQKRFQSTPDVISQAFRDLEKGGKL